MPDWWGPSFRPRCCRQLSCRFRKRSLSTHYDNDGSIFLRQVFQFDRNGNKIGYLNYNSNNLQTSTGRYELDLKGRKIAHYHDGTIQNSNVYDDHDNIIKEVYPTGAQTFFEYDNNGFAINQLDIKGGGFSFGGPNRKFTTFINDPFGNIIEMKVTNAETKELLFTQKNKLNNQGDEIESIGYNADGSVYNHTNYEYKYGKPPVICILSVV